MDHEFVNDVLQLPDCVIDAEQVINDEDFKDTGPGVFSEPASFLSEEMLASTPQCNAADIRVYNSFFQSYGTDVVTSAVFGGRITTSYEISKDEATKIEGSIYDTVKKIIRKYTKTHEVMETPTHTIMSRHAHDNEGREFDDADVNVGLDSDDVFFNSFVELGSENDNDEEDTHHHHSQKEIPNTHSSSHKISMDDILLRVSTSVDGGHALPVSTLGSGSFTRKEIDTWVQSLRNQGSPVRFNTIGIYDLLKHPLMIRAFFLYCGPYGGSVLSERWERSKFLKWQAIWFADIFEPKEYTSLPKWKNLISTQCGQVLRRKYETMINAQEYLRVKADAYVEFRER